MASVSVVLRTRKEERSQVAAHGTAGTALLGLGGFVLLGVSDACGELEQVRETIANQAWCRGCAVAAKPHGRRPDPCS